MKPARKRFFSSPSFCTGFTCLVLGMVSMGGLGCGTMAPSRAAVPPEIIHVAPSPSEFEAVPAKIVLVNPALQFVVIDFNSRRMPPVGTRLSVYRDGKNIGAAQTTEPVRAHLTTADVVQGEIRVGDEAR